jgi:hypothetical protein
MSLDANLDVAALLTMLEDETEEYRRIVEGEFAKDGEPVNYEVVCRAMYSKMCKMFEKLKSYMSENEELREFKASVDTAKFNFEVDSLLKDLQDSVVIPDEELENMRERSKEFTLENIDIWKNECKATAFSFAVKPNKSKEKDNGNGVTRVANPWIDKDKNTRKSVWENL